MTYTLWQKKAAERVLSLPLHMVSTPQLAVQRQWEGQDQSNCGTLGFLGTASGMRCLTPKGKDHETIMHGSNVLSVVLLANPGVIPVHFRKQNNIQPPRTRGGA